MCGVPVKGSVLSGGPTVLSGPHVSQGAPATLQRQVHHTLQLGVTVIGLSFHDYGPAVCGVEFVVC